MTYTAKPFAFIGSGHNQIQNTVDQRPNLKKVGEPDPKDLSVPEYANASPDDLVQLPALKKSTQAEDFSTTPKSLDVPPISPLQPSDKSVNAEKDESK